MTRRSYTSQPKMQCCDCGSWENIVLAHKLKQLPDGYRRRRRCKDCGAIFETLEIFARVVRSGRFDARTA